MEKVTFDTFLSKSERLDRLTFPWGGNSNRDFELKCSFENPRVVIWASNKMDWVSQNGLNDWHLNHFISAVKRYSEEHDLKHKTLLVLDNAVGHSAILV